MDKKLSLKLEAQWWLTGSWLSDLALKKSLLLTYRPAPWLTQRWPATCKECGTHQVSQTSFYTKINPPQLAILSPRLDLLDSLESPCRDDLHWQRLCHACAITPTYFGYTKVAAHVPHTTSTCLWQKYKIFIHHRWRATTKTVTQSLAEVPVTERAGAGRTDFPYKNTELDDDSWSWASHCYSKICKDQEKLCSVLPVHPWLNLPSTRIWSSVSGM